MNMHHSSQRLLETLTIQAVSQRAEVTKHTLRFWENELKGVLVPLRTQGGQRRYTSEHLFIIEEIKRLKREGFRLVDIKKKLDKNYNNVPENSNSQKINFLANQIAEIVRSTIYSFFQRENSNLDLTTKEPGDRIQPACAGTAEREPE